MSAASIEITDEFSAALKLLDAGHSMFLTGKAGTGKSTLIRHFMETTKRETLVVAPTGIAALNVGGYTIHQLFRFHTTTTLSDVISGDYYPTRFAAALRSVGTLIVDEASMVRADLLDMMNAALTRFGPEPGEPFGGVQIVLVGDLFQLAPVVTTNEEWYFRDTYDTPYFFSAASYTPEQFPLVQLTKVFRQIGDPELTRILNTVREGQLLEDARAHLNTRTAPDFEPPIGEFWLTLCTTNKLADSRNRRMLAQLPGDELHSHAMVSGEIERQAMPVDTELVLKPGAQVMLLNNDPSRRWVNGTIGQITSIYLDDDGELAAQIALRTGRVVDVGQHTWEVTEPVADSGHISHRVVGTVRQLPMRLSWAITIHKSQGQTVDRLVVDLTGGTFAYGQLYVALSRCTSMAGLVLRRDVLAKDLKVDQRVRRFLRSHSRRHSTSVAPAFVSALMVGEAGDRYRPRPVEIAVATEDGTEFSTLINPQRDLGSARSDFGISVADIQLAPTLPEAWPGIARALAGRPVVAASCDATLEYLDFELKRLGVLVVVPMGIEFRSLPFADGNTPTMTSDDALTRARAMRDSAVTHGWSAPGDADFFEAAPAMESGYTLTRDREFRLVGTQPPDLGHDEALAAHVRRAAERSMPSPELVAELCALGATLGEDLLPPEWEDPAAADLDGIFFDGARVCFTGTVLHSGREIDRSEMERRARKAGLAPVANVTKTKCDVLVVAELGTQSNKSRAAMKWGTPIVAAADFLDWLKN